MATAYTWPIEDGSDLTLTGYLRRMGTSTRDDSSEDFFKPEEVSNTYLEWAKTTEGEIRQIKALTKEQIEARIDAERLAQHQRNLDYSVKNHEVARRYETVRAKIKTWKAPRALRGTKALMLRHLEESATFAPYGVYELPRRPTAAEWRREQLKTLRQDLVRHRRRYREEVRAVAQRNDYRLELWAALKDLEEKGE